MIDSILPRGVAVAETRREIPGQLTPRELAALGRAVERRRVEFTTARMCAREALARLGAAPVGVGAGREGGPAWPAGIVGSITHCSGYRACAVARSGEVLSLGIDAEPDAALPEGVLEAVARPEELQRLDRLRRTQPWVRWDRVLFSAKEALYKAVHPLVGRRLGFEDAALVLHEGLAPQARSGGFTATLTSGSPPSAAGELRGRWLARDGLIMTALTIS